MNRARNLAQASLASICALGLGYPVAKADPVFGYTGSIQTWTVTTTGAYDITAYGAQGGNDSLYFVSGGNGAEIGGVLNLTQGEVLDVVVGGQGGDAFEYGTGGGGGTFVYTGDTPLVIAGGGGGAAAGTRGGGPGQTGTSGEAGTAGGAPGAGGTAGNGGQGGGNSSGGGGGAGWLSNGGDGGSGGGGGQGQGSFAGGAGVRNGDGGFGGGGGGGGIGGGGGGGYSGGGGGAGTYGQSNFWGGGGGGGSYLDGTATDTVFESGVNQGNGEVVITPEFVTTVPDQSSTLTLLAAGLAGSLLLRASTRWSPVRVRSRP